MYDVFQRPFKPTAAWFGLSNTPRDSPLALPYRGEFGEPRPDRLGALPLPPGRMPSRDRLRPLKAWRYVGVYGPELMLCAAVIRIGRARQSFWAVWDRRRRRLFERTAIGGRAVRLDPGRVLVNDRAVRVDLHLQEQDGIEVVCPTGQSYAWTRKQGGVRAEGVIVLDRTAAPLDARAVIDDTAAYYARQTSWQWSAGVGVAIDGREVAWNLVSGVNDPAIDSERTIWIAGEQFEPPPSVFMPHLAGVDRLHFHAEAQRERADNLLLLRSRYRQPFGAFAGQLPGGVILAEGHGVMEEHHAWW
jgi:hypothetical protein